MEYTLAMSFIIKTDLKSTINISGVKPTLTEAEANALMDIIISKNIFVAESGTFVSKDTTKLTERKVTKYEVA